MTERDLIVNVSRRPVMHAGARSLRALVGYFCGYMEACERLGNPIKDWPALFELVRTHISPQDVDNALAMDEVIRRRAGGDDERALEMFVQGLEAVLAANEEIGRHELAHGMDPH
jgi:hypothetical protein